MFRNDGTDATTYRLESLIRDAAVSDDPESSLSNAAAEVGLHRGRMSARDYLRLQCLIEAVRCRSTKNVE